MTVQTIYVIDQETRDEIASLHTKIDHLIALLESPVSQSDDNDWLTAREFCRNYSLSRTTLTRRLAEEPCKIKTLNTGGKKQLYRWNHPNGKKAESND